MTLLKQGGEIPPLYQRRLGGVIEVNKLLQPERFSLSQQNELPSLDELVRF